MRKHSEKRLKKPESPLESLTEEGNLDLEDTQLLEQLKDAHQAITQLKNSISHKKISLDIARRMQQKS